MSTINITLFDTLLTYTENWVYKQIGRNIYLYKADSINYYTPPTADLENGLAIMYTDPDGAFVDSDGVLVTDPDEAAVINVNEGFMYALMAYVKSELATDDDVKLKHMMDFHRLKGQFIDQMNPAAGLPKAHSNFTIHRRRRY